MIEKQELLNVINQKKTISEIAQIFGVAKSTISNYLKNMD